MTRPVWKLMNRLEMFKHCETDCLENTEWLADRIVNIPSSVRLEKMKPLILVGGGGHCKSVIEAAESMGLAIGGIFDLLENVGGRILGYPVIGTDDDIPPFGLRF